MPGLASSPRVPRAAAPAHDPGGCSPRPDPGVWRRGQRGPWPSGEPRRLHRALADRGPAEAPASLPAKCPPLQRPVGPGRRVGSPRREPPKPRAQTSSSGSPSRLLPPVPAAPAGPAPGRQRVGRMTRRNPRPLGQLPRPDRVHPVGRATPRGLARRARSLAPGCSTPRTGRRPVPLEPTGRPCTRTGTLPPRGSAGPPPVPARGRAPPPLAPAPSALGDRTRRSRPGAPGGGGVRRGASPGSTGRRFAGVGRVQGPRSARPLRSPLADGSGCGQFRLVRSAQGRQAPHAPRLARRGRSRRRESPPLRATPVDQRPRKGRGRAIDPRERAATLGRPGRAVRRGAGRRGGRVNRPKGSAGDCSTRPREGRRAVWLGRYVDGHGPRVAGRGARGGSQGSG